MATDASILAWEIPRAEEPGELRPVESQSFGYDIVTEPTNTQSV